MISLSRAAARSLAVVGVAAAAATACSSSGGSPASPASTPASTNATPTSQTPASTSVAPSTSTAPSSSAATSAAARQTVRATLRPVTSSGRVADGYTVKAGQGSIDCSSGMRSPVAVTGGVLFCSPSAAYAIACWKAGQANAAYCLTDARHKRLLRYRVSGSFPQAQPAERQPRPFDLTLADGTYCTLRDSGAGARLQVHPDWIQYYYCGQDDALGVWAPSDSATGGITDGDGPSQVQLAASDGSGSLTTKSVTRAEFVGTAQ